MIVYAVKRICAVIKHVIREGVSGSIAYYGLMAMLTILAAYGLIEYVRWQIAPILPPPLHNPNAPGMLATDMNNVVFWGLYIALFIYWVGIAAAGVVFGIAGYGFGHKGFEKIAVLAEAQAIAALIIAMGLVLVDVGRPLRAMMLLPQLPNFPKSMLDWDMVVLNGYLILNIIGYVYTVHRLLAGLGHSRLFEKIFIVIAAPFAIGIHTVTAFISQALVARPIWNNPLLAPRYVATAFASGPALLLLALLVLERRMGLKVDRDVYEKTMLVIAGALTVGLYFTLSEVHEIFWYTTEPLKRAQALVTYFGAWDPYVGALTWMWIILGVLVTLMIIFIPRTRRDPAWVAALSIITLLAVACEKTLIIVVPGFTPGPLGRVLPYWPTPLEFIVTVAVHALGFIIFVVLAKAAAKAIIMEEQHHHGGAAGGEAVAEAATVAAAH